MFRVVLGVIEKVNRGNSRGSSGGSGCCLEGSIGVIEEVNTIL